MHTYIIHTYIHRADKQYENKKCNLNTVKEKENAYKNNLVRTSVGKTLLVKRGSKWGNNIKMGPKRRISGVDWISLAENAGQWRVL